MDVCLKNIGFKTCNGILNLSYWSAIYMGERVKLATSFSKFAWKRMIELKRLASQAQVGSIYKKIS